MKQFSQPQAFQADFILDKVRGHHFGFWLIGRIQMWKVRSPKKFEATSYKSTFNFPSRIASAEHCCTGGVWAAAVCLNRTNGLNSCLPNCRCCAAPCRLINWTALSRTTFYCLVIVYKICSRQRKSITFPRKVSRSLYHNFLAPLGLFICLL